MVIVERKGNKPLSFLYVSPTVRQRFKVNTIKITFLKKPNKNVRIFVVSACDLCAADWRCMTVFLAPGKQDSTRSGWIGTARARVQQRHQLSANHCVHPSRRCLLHRAIDRSAAETQQRESLHSPAVPVAVCSLACSNYFDRGGWCVKCDGEIGLCLKYPLSFISLEPLPTRAARPLLCPCFWLSDWPRLWKMADPAEGGGSEQDDVSFLRTVSAVVT